MDEMHRAAFSVAVVITILAALTYVIVGSRRTTVHRIPIPGHPSELVEFIQTRAMDGEDGYIVRFPNGAETKEAFVSIDVPLQELRSKSRVEYVDKTLIVHGPHGERVEISGYAF